MPPWCSVQWILIVVSASIINGNEMPCTMVSSGIVDIASFRGPDGIVVIRECEWVGITPMFKFERQTRLRIINITMDGGSLGIYTGPSEGSSMELVNASISHADGLMTISVANFSHFDFVIRGCNITAVGSVMCVKAGNVSQVVMTIEDSNITASASDDCLVAGITIPPGLTSVTATDVTIIARRSTLNASSLLRGCVVGIVGYSPILTETLISAQNVSLVAEKSTVIAHSTNGVSASVGVQATSDKYGSMTTIAANGLRIHATDSHVKSWGLHGAASVGVACLSGRTPSGALLLAHLLSVFAANSFIEAFSMHLSVAGGIASMGYRHGFAETDHMSLVAMHCDVRSTATQGTATAMGICFLNQNGKTSSEVSNVVMYAEESALDAISNGRVVSSFGMSFHGSSATVFASNISMYAVQSNVTASFSDANMWKVVAAVGFAALGSQSSYEATITAVNVVLYAVQSNITAFSTARFVSEDSVVVSLGFGAGGRIAKVILQNVTCNGTWSQVTAMSRKKGSIASSLGVSLHGFAGETMMQADQLGIYALHSNITAWSSGSSAAAVGIAARTGYTNSIVEVSNVDLFAERCTVFASATGSGSAASVGIASSALSTHTSQSKITIRNVTVLCDHCNATAYAKEPSAAAVGFSSSTYQVSALLRGESSSIQASNVVLYSNDCVATSAAETASASLGIASSCRHSSSINSSMENVTMYSDGCTANSSVKLFAAASFGVSAATVVPPGPCPAGTSNVSLYSCKSRFESNGISGGIFANSSSQRSAWWFIRGTSLDAEECATWRPAALEGPSSVMSDVDLHCTTKGWSLKLGSYRARDVVVGNVYCNETCLDSQFPGYQPGGGAMLDADCSTFFPRPKPRQRQLWPELSRSAIPHTVTITQPSALTLTPSATFSSISIQTATRSVTFYTGIEPPASLRSHAQSESNSIESTASIDLATTREQFINQTATLPFTGAPAIQNRTMTRTPTIVFDEAPETKEFESAAIGAVTVAATAVVVSGVGGAAGGAAAMDLQALAVVGVMQCADDTIHGVMSKSRRLITPLRVGGNDFALSGAIGAVVGSVGVLTLHCVVVVVLRRGKTFDESARRFHFPSFSLSIVRLFYQGFAFDSAIVLLSADANAGNRIVAGCFLAAAVVIPVAGMLWARRSCTAKFSLYRYSFRGKSWVMRTFVLPSGFWSSLDRHQTFFIKSFDGLPRQPFFLLPFAQAVFLAVIASMNSFSCGWRVTTITTGFLLLATTHVCLRPQRVRSSVVMKTIIQFITGLVAGTKMFPFVRPAVPVLTLVVTAVGVIEALLSVAISYLEKGWVQQECEQRNAREVGDDDDRDVPMLAAAVTSNPLSST